jgi:hypothetical protein
LATGRVLANGGCAAIDRIERIEPRGKGLASAVTVALDALAEQAKASD